MEIVESNVVVAARQFNPSILTQLWLVRNGIVGEDEFLPGSVVTDGLCQFQTERFILIAIPNLLQVSLRPLVAVPDEGALMADNVGGMVRSLPHTPYSAVGLNFVWHETPRNQTV